MQMHIFAKFVKLIKCLLLLFLFCKTQYPSYVWVLQNIFMYICRVCGFVCLLICFTFLFVSSAYISAARRLSPSVPRELEEYIASAYSGIRQEEAKSNTPHSYTTVRTLLSILRISSVSMFFAVFFLFKVLFYLFGYILKPAFTWFVGWVA